MRYRRCYYLRDTINYLRNPAMLRDLRSRAEERVAPVREALAAMSPEERASQAWVESRSGDVPLVPAHSGKARPLVAFNPGLVDPTRPRGKIQFLVLTLEEMDLDHPLPPVASGQRFDFVAQPPRWCVDVARGRMWELLHQLDWSRLLSLMD